MRKRKGEEEDDLNERGHKRLKAITGTSARTLADTDMIAIADPAKPATNAKSFDRGKSATCEVEGIMLALDKLTSTRQDALWLIAQYANTLYNNLCSKIFGGTFFTFGVSFSTLTLHFFC